MNKSEQVNELAAALSKTQAALNRAKESATNPFLKNSYADLGDVWDAAREPMTANGLSVAQFPTSTAEAIGLTTVLMHASGQWLEDTVYLPLSDERGKSQAQVAGSIISYLRRYGLSAVLGIVTGEDDDGNAGRDPRQQQKRPAQKQQAPASPPPVEWDDLTPASAEPPQDKRGASSPAEQAKRANRRPKAEPVTNGNGTPEYIGATELKRLHALGTETYGPDWDEKRPQLVKAVTKGRTESSKELTPDEAQRLEAGMREKLEA